MGSKGSKSLTIPVDDDPSVKQQTTKAEVLEEETKSIPVVEDILDIEKVPVNVKLAPYLQIKSALDHIASYESLCLGYLEDPIPLRNTEKNVDQETFQNIQTSLLLQKIETACQEIRLPSPITQVQADLENLANGLPYGLWVNFGKMEDLGAGCIVLMDKNDDGTDRVVDVPRELNALLTFAEKSTYYDVKTQETTVNETVLLAYEITQLEELPCLMSLLEYFKLHVSKFMFNGQPITFVRDKLNIYPVGGHFKRHVDKPRENNVGSLVISLPLFQHLGGNFFIWPTQDGKVEQSGYTEITSASNSITATAFYSYCPHEVQLVEQDLSTQIDSARVTITYFIIQDPKKLALFHAQEITKFGSTSAAQEFRLLESLTYKNISYVTGWNPDFESCEQKYEATFFVQEFDEHDQFLEEEKVMCEKIPHSEAPQRDLFTQLRNIQKNLDFLLQKGHNCDGGVGILLKHPYSASESKNNLLKGIDLYLFDCLLDLFGCTYNVFILPVLVNHTERYVDNECENRQEGDSTQKVTIYRFTESDIEEIYLTYSSKKTKRLIETGSKKKLLIENVQDQIRFIGNPYANGELLNHKKKKYIPNTGNKCRLGLIENQYFLHALIITKLDHINNAKTWKLPNDYVLPEPRIFKKQKVSS